MYQKGGSEKELFQLAKQDLFLTRKVFGHGGNPGARQRAKKDQGGIQARQLWQEVRPPTQMRP